MKKNGSFVHIEELKGVKDEEEKHTLIQILEVCFMKMGVFGFLDD